MERTGAAIFKVFLLYILLSALIALFVLHFTVLMKIIKKLVARAPDGGKKEPKEIERTYAVIFTIIFALFHFAH